MFTVTHSSVISIFISLICSYTLLLGIYYFCYYINHVYKVNICLLNVVKVYVRRTQTNTNNKLKYCLILHLTHPSLLYLKKMVKTLFLLQRLRNKLYNLY